MVPFAPLLVWSLLTLGQVQAPRQAPPPRTPPSTDPSQQTQPSQTAAPAASATDAQSIDSVVSIDRIRKALERQPTLTFVMPDPNVPRYRVEIQGGQFKPSTFLNSFYIPPTLAPVPLGGIDYYDMQRLNTPSQFWGSAPFTNKDLLGMAALNGAYSLLGALIKKGMEAHASAAEANARQEVQQELNALAEHNARIAAGQPDGTDQATTKKPPPKKPDKKVGKKKEDEKKEPK